MPTNPTPRLVAALRLVRRSSPIARSSSERAASSSGSPPSPTAPAAPASSWASAPVLPPGAVAVQPLSAVPRARDAPKEECGTAPAPGDDLEDSVPMVDPRTKEWGGPTKGGAAPEPTRFGDWERKGRCTDFS